MNVMREHRLICPVLRCFIKWSLLRKFNLSSKIVVVSMFECFVWKTSHKSKTFFHFQKYFWRKIHSKFLLLQCKVRCSNFKTKKFLSFYLDLERPFHQTMTVKGWEKGSQVKEKKIYKTMTKQLIGC
jgi:hypothetical protein